METPPPGLFDHILDMFKFWFWEAEPILNSKAIRIKHRGKYYIITIARAK